MVFNKSFNHVILYSLLCFQTFVHASTRSGTTYSCTLISFKKNKQMLTVVAEARVQHASLKTNFASLLKTTRLSHRVQQPKQSVLPEKATRVTPCFFVTFLD
ncbi:hypothetical protein Hanom_Chr12g01133301 [Helianthus anomalus]